MKLLQLNYNNDKISFFLNKQIEFDSNLSFSSAKAFKSVRRPRKNL